MSDTKFNPLRTQARLAKRMRREMLCNPQWVLDVFDELDSLRAEVERTRQALERIHARAEAYTEDGRGMTECSTLVVAEIAHAALEGFR